MMESKRPAAQKLLPFSVDALLATSTTGDDEGESPAKRIKYEDVSSDDDTDPIAVSTPDPSPNDDIAPDTTSSSPKETKKRKIECSKGFITKDGITVELVGQDLWKKFHRLGTEMIITKAGRRMFPTLKIRTTGLDPMKNYMIYLEIVSFDDKRYRYVYHSSQWMIAGSGDPPPSPNVFIHGDSPNRGDVWTSQGIVSFDKLKLTNNRSSIMQGQVCLHSMHKYIPKIHIQEINANDGIKPELSLLMMEKLVDVDNALTFEFPETTFTTVTAYQNQQITKLKIASNPFAKGFREATRPRDHHYTDYTSPFFGAGPSKPLDALFPPGSFFFPPQPSPFLLQSAADLRSLSHHLWPTAIFPPSFLQFASQPTTLAEETIKQDDSNR